MAFAASTLRFAHASLGLGVDGSEFAASSVYDFELRALSSSEPQMRGGC